jgi:hypothetical protein
MEKIIPLTKEQQKELKDMKIKVQNFLKKEVEFAKNL